MPFCGCLRSCCGKKHGYEVRVADGTPRGSVNRAYEDDKKQEKEVALSKEEYLWKAVLEELVAKSTSLRSRSDDLEPRTSMSWVFKVLKPIKVESAELARESDANSNQISVIKISLSTKVAQVNHTATMHNVVPSIGKPAPSFRGTAVVNGEFKEISLEDYEGKYLVFFFYPLDFTFVCPTEIIAFSERVKEFRDIGCEVVACSTDSHFSHLAWVNTSRKEGGLGHMDIPILADKSMEVAKAYGVLKEEDGIAYRGLFIIDSKQNLRQVTINDLPVGRDVDETLRLVQAFQFTDEHGEVCPAGWKPGSKSMKADPEGSKDYFSSQN